MAKKCYVGVDGVARNTKSIYIGVDGVARKVKRGYIGVNGVAQLFWAGLDVATMTINYTGDYTDSIVTQSGKQYRLLTLTSSGTLTLEEPVTADICAVGGGAAGGNAANGNTTSSAKGAGGGGGAGYVTNAFSQELGADGIVVTIGAGGTNSVGYGAGSSGTATTLIQNGSEFVVANFGNGGSEPIRTDSSGGFCGGPGGSGNGNGGNGAEYLRPTNSHCAATNGVSSTVYLFNDTTLGLAGSGGGGGAGMSWWQSVCKKGYGANGGGNGGNSNSSATGSEGKNATKYGGGGGGAGPNDYTRQVMGGSGMQGVVYIRIPLE